jgi:hypothetical protein
MLLDLGLDGEVSYVTIERVTIAELGSQALRSAKAGGNLMATVTVEVPDDAFFALRRSPREFAADMRLAASIQWYYSD